MKRVLLIALLVVTGCQGGVTPTSSPAPTPGVGPEGLAADLTAAGVGAGVGGTFMSDPIGGAGRIVCVGDESIQTYRFIDHEAALAAVMKIDRNDPSHIGNGIVEWIGPPRFWLRGNLIVLYVGQDPALDAALRALLGQPFAESRDPGRGGLLPKLPCK